LKKNKNINKGKKIKRIKIKKKQYTKNNETLIKDSKKKNKKL